MPRYCLTLVCALISGLPWMPAAEAGSRTDVRPVAAVSGGRDLRPPVPEKFLRDLHPDLIRKTIQRYL